MTTFTASLNSFKYVQPKSADLDELLNSNPDIREQLVDLNKQYEAASKHYKRCVNRQASYLLSSQTDKAATMRNMVNEMRELKTSLIKARKELAYKLLQEEYQTLLKSTKQ